MSATHLAADADVGDDDAREYGCPVADSLGQTCIHPTREQYVDVSRRSPTTATRWSSTSVASTTSTIMSRPLPDGVAPERFEVVVNLLDIGNRRRTRLRVQVPEGDPIVAVAVRPAPRHRSLRARDLRHVRHRRSSTIPT